MAAKKKKRRFSTLRFRKSDAAHNVLVAVNRWVRKNGGSLIIIGGIGVQEGFGIGKFDVVVHCLGRKPVKKDGV